MNTKRVLLVAGIAAWMGCAAPPEEADAPEAEAAPAMAAIEACSSPTGELTGDATLVGSTGDFTFTMVDGSEGGRSVTGSLTLMQQVDGLETWAQVATPLYGFSDIELEGVGAAEVGEVSSADAEAPGVLVMEDQGPDGPRIRIRLGSRANTRGASAFDGGYTILTVTQMTGSDFAGEWRSAAQGPVTEGWFCARRAGAAPSP